MNTPEIIAAADRALEWLAAATDEELMAALEECDGTIAYAIDPNYSRFFEPGLSESITDTGRQIMSNLISDK